MGETIRARVRRGVLEPVEKITLPEGKEVTVMILDVPGGDDAEAFRRSAGGWKGTFDAAKLIQVNYAGRLVQTPSKAIRGRYPISGSEIYDLHFRLALNGVLSLGVYGLRDLFSKIVLSTIVGNRGWYPVHDDQRADSFQRHGRVAVAALASLTDHTFRCLLLVLKS